MDYLNDKQALKHFDELLKDRKLRKKIKTVKLNQTSQMLVNRNFRRALMVSNIVLVLDFIWLLVLILFLVFNSSNADALSIYTLGIVLGMIIFPLMAIPKTFLPQYILDDLEKQVLYVKLIANLNGHDEAERKDYEDAKRIVESNNQEWELRF
ncbi:hypothetical protein C1940_17410 (plasmid) [Lactiplantibacillus plantarum subsp. plantarum]|uniref:hypothetical protein n=1 Tax=Lactiplantibacillus plantarum TaxID=1590 RepID=UPI000CD333FB|nr:hypothetical protein [Lactiplantibacillus plantarum]AUV74229.1 hypothetical protein C1940_17410 [Lactiplantibacillus plantarum subsp. plantarum]